MRTRILIPLLAAALLAPAATAPVAAGEATHGRGFRGQVPHQREVYPNVKPHGPRSTWTYQRPVFPPRFAARFDHVGRPHAQRGWYVPPRRPRLASPPRHHYFAPPLRPHPGRWSERPRVVVIVPWRW